MPEVSQERMIREAESYSDMWEDGHPGCVGARTLVWKMELEFSITKSEIVPAGEHAKCLVVTTGLDLEASDKYRAEFRQAIEDGTIEPIIMVQGTDGNFCFLDGLHRMAWAEMLGKRSLPAWVGYQPTNA